MSEMNPTSFSSRGERVRIYVPHEASFDLAKMSKITASVLDQLGCPACHSGRILDFVTLRDFVVNPGTLDVQPVIGPQPLASQGTP